MLEKLANHIALLLAVDAQALLKLTSEKNVKQIYLANKPFYVVV